MTYTVFSKEDLLTPISHNVDKEQLLHYGEILKEIYDNYEDGKVVGYVLENNFYALETGKK